MDQAAIDWFKGTFTWLGVPGWFLIGLYIVYRIVAGVFSIADFVGNFQTAHRWTRTAITYLPGSIRWLGAQIAQMSTGAWRALTLLVLVVGFGLILTAGFVSSWNRTVTTSDESGASGETTPNHHARLPGGPRLDERARATIRTALQGFAPGKVTIAIEPQNASRRFAEDVEKVFRELEWEVNPVVGHVLDSGIYVRHESDELKGVAFCRALAESGIKFTCEGTPGGGGSTILVRVGSLTNDPYE